MYTVWDIEVSLDLTACGTDTYHWKAVNKYLEKKIRLCKLLCRPLFVILTNITYLSKSEKKNGRNVSKDEGKGLEMDGAQPKVQSQFCLSDSVNNESGPTFQQRISGYTARIF